MFILVFSAFASAADLKTGFASASGITTVRNTLAPSTPAEATFEETSASTMLLTDAFILAPVNSDSVTFEDFSAETAEPDSFSLAPVTPAEAAFDDSAAGQDIRSLSPAFIPEADFEELP